jgi:prepilin-type N-terminal cleavage/methylation domain-containing protein
MDRTTINAKNHKTSSLPGFTIIELLVVIVVIGILASITIVSYSGITQQATVASLQSDLRSADKQLNLYNATYGVYPFTFDSNYCPLTPVPDASYCLKSNNTNFIHYITSNGSSSRSYCLAFENNSTIYHTISNDSPSSGECPGINIYETMQTAPSTGYLYGNTADTQWNSNGYLVLTAATNAEYGYIDYQQTLPENFDIGFDFWMGPNNPGADAIWFYWGAAGAPVTESSYSGGYIAALDEYWGQNRPFRIGFNGIGDIASTTGASPYSDSKWHHCDIRVRGTNIEMSYDGYTMLSVNDSARTLGGDHFGLGSRTGGANNEHRVKNFTLIYI